MTTDASMTTKRKVTVYLEANLLKALRHAALDDDDTLSSTVQRAVQRYLDDNTVPTIPVALGPVPAPDVLEDKKAQYRPRNA